MYTNPIGWRKDSHHYNVCATSVEVIWKEMSKLVQENVKMSFCIFILEETFEITNRYRSKVVTFFSVNVFAIFAVCKEQYKIVNANKTFVRLQNYKLSLYKLTEEDVFAIFVICNEQEKIIIACKTFFFRFREL